MKLGIKIKKTFSIVSILSILVSFSLPFSSVYAQSQSTSYSSVITAVMGCSGAGAKISSLLTELFEGKASSDVPTTSDEEKENNKKEKCWDAIGYAAAKTALAALTQTTINYINSGFEGNPYFARHENSLLASIGNQEVYSFVSELNNPEKYPFGPEIAQSIATIHGCEDPTDNGACFRDTAVFTLAEDIGENWEDFGDDFSVGGWEGWLSTTQNPYNNPIGFNFEASKEISRRINKEQSTIKDEISTNGGFLSVKKCVAYYQVEEVTTTTKDGTFTSYEKVLDDNGNPIISTVDSGDATNDKEILYYNNAGNPVYDTGDISSSYDYEYSYLGEVDHCARYETTTPGSVISDQLNIHLGSSVRQLELADEMNESLGAVFDALINKLVYDGLDALQTASLDTTQSGGYGANDAYYNTNGDNAWYTDPLAPVDLYLALRCIEDGSVIPGSDLGTNGGFWNDLYKSDPYPYIPGGTAGIGADDIAGEYEAGGLAGGEIGGIYDPDAIEIDGSPVTVFGVQGGTKGPLENINDIEPACKTAVALTEEYVALLSEARDLVSKDLLPTLRKIDYTLPEPDIKWEDRVYNAYIKERNALQEATDAELFIDLLYSLPLSGIVAGISNALGYCPDCDLEEARISATETLDILYPREVDRIQYDIEHHNLPSAPIARVERDKIPTYEEVEDAYGGALSAQQANLSRLNYIDSQLPAYEDRDNPENALLMERLQATFAYASPTLASQSVIDTTKTEITNIGIDIETAKNILPVIESENISCGWYPFGCHNPIVDENYTLFRSRLYILQSRAGDGADGSVNDFTTYDLINWCYPDGVTMKASFYAIESLSCELPSLKSRLSLATDDLTKDMIWVVHLYSKKQLIPIDITANPYSIWYPGPNPPYNPWGTYQLIDPGGDGDACAGVSADYDCAKGNTMYSYYLALEGRRYFDSVGEATVGDSIINGQIHVNRWIAAYENPEY